MDRNNGGDPLAPPRPPKPQQPRVHHHQQQQQQQQHSQEPRRQHLHNNISSSGHHHRPRAPEPLPNSNMSDERLQQQQQQHPHHHQQHIHHPEELLQRSSSSASSIRRPPPPRPPATEQQQQQADPVLPLPPRVPLKPTVLHAANITTAQPSHSPPVQGTTPPTIAPLVPLQQQQQQQQQTSITFGRRPHASPVQPNNSSSSSSLSSATTTLTIPQRGGSSPSPSRSFNSIGGAGGGGASTTTVTGTPIITTLTRNITNLSNNLISNLVSSHGSTTATTAAGAADTVTLAVPRPENERLTNEYVDTPFIQQQQHRQGGGNAGASLHAGNAQQQHSTTPQLSLRPNSHLTSHPSSRTTVVTSQPTSPNGPTARLLSADSPGLITTESPLGPRKQLLGRVGDARDVITKQPLKAKKDLDATATSAALHSIDKLDRAELSAHLIDGGVMGGGGGVAGVGEDGHHRGDGLFSNGLTANGTPSITCPQCEKCRCEGCQRPRPLPSRWLCGKSCLCSAETVLDYATCLCCVKALFYHCSKDHENSISCADDPCSCLPHRRAARWGCLGALSVFLPCLACYWPMRGAISLCAACYANQSRKGCRCNQKGGRPTQMQLQTQQFGRDGPLRGSMVRGGESGGNGRGIPGGPKKVFPVDHHHNHHHHSHHHHSHHVKNAAEAGNGKKVGGEELKGHADDCDRAEEQDRLASSRLVGGSGREEQSVQSGSVGVTVGLVNGSSAAVDSDSSSSCGGGHLVRTLRLKPNSTSSTSSSQLSLLRHPADETPPRHLLD